MHYAHPGEPLKKGGAGTSRDLTNLTLRPGKR
jgi:hypothetical protein